jgi:hypothetical protein
MLYGLSYLGWSSDPSSFKAKDQFLWNYVLSLSSVLSSHRHQWLLAQAPSLEFPAHPTSQKVTSWSEPGAERSWAILGQTIPGATHHTWVKQVSQEKHWTMSSTPGDTRVTLKRLVGLLFLLHLRNCITTVSVPQASSPITVKFDACLAILCGNLNNQCYIQDSEIYVCLWPGPSSCCWNNHTSQYNDPPWRGMDNKPKRKCCTGSLMVFWLYGSIFLETYTAQNANS